MSVSNEDIESGIKTTDPLLDTSVNDAKWLLGSVATLGFFVMAVGLFASTLAV